MAALPSTAIALPTTSLLWYRPSCPRHSTYKIWQDISEVCCKMACVVKNAQLHAVLGPVLQWLQARFEQLREKSFAANCSCEDEEDSEDS